MRENSSEPGDRFHFQFVVEEGGHRERFELSPEHPYPGQSERSEAVGSPQEISLAQCLVESADTFPFPSTKFLSATWNPSTNGLF